MKIVDLAVGQLSPHLPAYVDRDDLHQAGCIGLMAAIDNWDSTRGCSLHTYAYIRVHGAILDELRAHDWMPRTVRQRLKQIEKGRKETEQRLKRNATLEEIADSIGVPARRVDKWMQRHLRIIQELEISTHGSSPYQHAMDPLDHAILGNMLDNIDRVMRFLTAKEREAVILYFSTEDTLQNVADAMRLTESRICQLITSARRKLAARLRILERPKWIPR